MRPRGIILFGPNGAGKSTVGAELARLLGFKFMDIEAYAFEKSEIPYAATRPREDCHKLILADIEKHRSFVLSAVTGEFGDAIVQYYALAVYITAPKELRMERIRQRAYDQHGDRVLEGGDMYEQEQGFFEWAAARDLSKIDRWAETLTCPVIKIDGSLDWRANAAIIAEAVKKLLPIQTQRRESARTREIPQ